jgi:hypothetical protein
MRNTHPSMKQTLILIFTFFTTLICYGQKEHLEPEKDLSQYHALLKNRSDTFFTLLYRDFSDKPYARYTSMPSFSREYAFSVEQKDDKYFIISNYLSENYWCAKNPKSVKVRNSLTEIEEDLYKSIGDLFQLLAKQTRKREDNEMGNDGTTYYFATLDTSGQAKIGKTWSPNGNSVLNRLVKICDKLYLAGQGNDIPEDGIEKDIKKLITDLEE